MDIQGLRALAVLLVVLSHVNVINLSGGYVGVDVFFVISGYLITQVIIREYTANAAQYNGLGWFSIRAFYLRRFIRIVPVAFLVLISTTVSAYLLFNDVRAQRISIDALWSALFLANFHFIGVETNYFQQGFSTSPLQHFWSLAVEEQFYLVFPTLLLGVVSLHGLRIFKFKLWWDRRIIILIGFLSLLSFSWAVYSTSNSPSSSYFSSLTRAWELGLGALLALFTHSSQRILGVRLRNLLSLLGFAAILFAAFSFTSSTPFPSFYTLIPTLGTVLIIGTGINVETHPQSIFQKISRFRFISYLGDISYSVYLWHLPILIMASETLDTDTTSFKFKIAVLILIILVSALTYFLYENPIRKKIKVPAKWYQKKMNLYPKIRVNSLYKTAGVLLVFF